jgi:dipeptide transport system substrate-binding protein
MKYLKKVSTFMVLVSVCVLSTAQAKKVLVYCTEGSPSGFNPQIVTDGTSYNASAATIFNRLISYEYGTTNLVPGLAESWSVSEDGKTYRFKLKKGIQFHKNKHFTPSRDFNADDVLFSFNRQRLGQHPYHLVGGGNYEYFTSMGLKELIKDIKKIDAHTVEFLLHKSEAPFLAMLGMAFASIHSAEYADHLAKKNQKDLMDTSPIGTGPFVFKKYVRDSLIRFTANKNYFRGKPKLDGIIFSITPDPSVRYQKLKAGECHFVTFPAPSDISLMEKNSNIAVLKQQGLNIAYLAMNTAKKPFDNPLVRKAVNLALNKQSYIDAIYLGKGQVAKNPIPPTLWGYNQKIQDYEHNIAEAKKLLKKAGLPNGFTTDLWTLPVSRPYNPNGKKMGEMMQADLAKVGIKVELKSYDWPTYLAKSRNGEHMMVQLGWTGDMADPDNFLHVLLGCQSVESGSNLARWCNKEFDAHIEKAKRLTGQNQRAKLYEKAQKIFKQQAPWVTIAHSIVFKAMSSDVKNFKIDPLGLDFFYEVDLAKK